MQQRSLDFSLLPDESAFQRRSILIPTADEFNVALAEMPETLGRLRSAIMFGSSVGKLSEPWRVSAYLRAGLSDFCSVEEMQKTDRPSAEPFKIDGSRDPLLHFLELLRHLNVHVRTVSSISHTINIEFKDQTSELEVFVIDRLSQLDVAGLRNARFYSKEDLKRMTHWFEEMQMHWGAGDLLVMGAKRLGSEICKHYGLRRDES